MTCHSWIVNNPSPLTHMRSELSLARYPRITVARLMVAIAIIGLVLSGPRWINAISPTVMQRRSIGLKIALKHEREIQRWKEITGWVDEPDLELVITPNAPIHSASLTASSR